MTSTADRVKSFADQFGLTLASDAQAALPRELRELHRAVLSAFVAAGAAPTTDWVAERARRIPLDPGEALARLARHDLVHTDGGVVTVAYPFSGSPTPHRVQLDTGPACWAMCAIDALGIPLMTRRDATITTTDPHSGDPIRIRHERGRWHWDPPGVVVLVAATTGCATAAEAACRYIHFSTDVAHADAHLRAHPALAGQVYDQATAIEAAQAVFVPLLGQ